MATTFLSRFQRDKSERQILNENNNNKDKEKQKSNGIGFSLSLSRSSATLSTSNNTTNKPTIEQTTTTNTNANSNATEQQPRQQRRYIRSATAASVTQLLSEGCNNLLQRFRRNPSERPDKIQNQQQQKLNW